MSKYRRDIQGVFWLEEDPDNRVSGRLNFDESGPPKLFIIAGELLDGVPGFGSVNRIHGESISSELVLVNCRLIGASLGWHTTDQIFSIETVVSGASFSANEPLEFESTWFRLQHLEKWLGVTGIRWDIPRVPDPERYSLALEPTEITPVVSNGRRIDLNHNFTLEDGSIKGFKEHWEFQFTYSKLKPLDEIEEEIVAIRNLITIGAGAPSAIFKLECAPDRQKRIRKHKSGVTTEDLPASLFAERFSGGDAKQSIRSVALFGFNDIGGLETVRQWIDNLNAYELVINWLVNHWYVPNISPTHRFLNAYTAAESFVRIELGEQNLSSFKKHLVNRANHCCQWFAPLIRNLDGWASKAVQVRTNQVVHAGLMGSSDKATLNDLADSIYLLVVILLLRKSGCNQKALESLRDSPQVCQWRNDWCARGW